MLFLEQKRLFWKRTIFASSIFLTQLLKPSDLYNRFFHPFHRVRLKAFDVAVMVQCTEGDVKKTRTATLDVVPNIAMLGTMTGRCRNLFFRSVCLECGSRNYCPFSTAIIQSLRCVISRFRSIFVNFGIRPIFASPSRLK